MLKDSTMRLRVIPLIVALAILVGPLAVAAQPLGQAYRIGILSTDPPIARLWEPLLDGLRERGYSEGRNLVFERRFSEGHAERFPELAAELVQLRVDCIIVPTEPAALAAQHATQTIPIVMTAASDPVSAGLVANLAQPGGNITGLTSLGPELSGKRLELLKEVVPGLTRVAVLWNPVKPADAVRQEIQAATHALGLQLHAQEVRSTQDFEGAFARTRQARPEALLVLTDNLIAMHVRQIVAFATQEHLPSVFATRGGAVAGGLMSYGPSLPDLYRRVATYVDKILKGAKPADLPIEQPMKFELVINLKTAKALGLTMPPTLLMLADEVIRED